MGSELLERYRAMCLMRAFEEACAQGVTSGELRGELHLGIGQEAVAAAMIGTLRPGDWMVATHRSHLAAIAKGVPLRPLLAEIYEKATGLCGGKGGHLHLFDPGNGFSTTGIVGSSLSVALGHAYAVRLAGTAAVAVGITGDGGTNTGQFHEALNMAALWALPLVVLVEDNGYGISVKADRATAAPGIAARAAAYGAWSRRVDGTDVAATAEAFAEAAGHARSGGGPALLVAECHRFSGHYEGDPDHYRTKAEKETMRATGDPLLIARRRLIAGGEATDQVLDRLRRDAEEEIERLLADVRSDPAPDPAQARSGVYVEATA